MKHILTSLLLASSLLFTAGCTDKRESDVDSNFTPGVVKALVKALASNKTTDKNVSVSGTLPIADANGSVTYSALINPLQGSVIIDAATGAYTYTPNVNFVGIDSFQWKVQDGTSSAIAVVTINVLPKNYAPVLVNQTFTINEDTPLSNSISGSDPDGDTLTYNLVSSPSNGTIVLNPNGTFTYTPNANFSGSDSFQVKANDGSLNSNTSTVSINVSPVNDAPVAQNKSILTAEDTAASVVLTATDVDSSSLSYAIVSGPAHGTLSGTAPNLTYTPHANYNGSDSFTYKANDGSLDSNVATVSISVSAQNDIPVAQPQTIMGMEDVAINGNLTAFDADGDALTYAILSSPAHGTITLNAATGSFVYTPALNYNGPDSFTFQVNDGSSLSNIATVSISLGAVNDAPVANNQNTSTPEDTAKAIVLTASDVDSNTLTYTVVSSPAHGTLTGSAPNLVYTPNANYNGPDSFSFRANDGSLDSNVATVSIFVESVNDAPIADDGSLVLTSGTSANGTLVASDVDGNALTYSLVSSPTKGSVIVNANGSYTYSANVGTSGSDTFTFRANDGSINSNVATITITINSGNHAPVANPSSLAVVEDTPASGTATATDADGDALTYILVSGPAHGTLVFNVNGTYTYTPNGNFNGTDSFSFKANDGTTDSNVATITLNVSPVNDAPVANNKNVTTPEDTILTSNLVASDVDGNTLTYSLVSAPTKGSVVINPTTGVFTFTPNANANGMDSFTFKVNDGTVDSNIATVSINIISVNDLPVAYADSITTAEDTAANIVLSAYDVEGDFLTYTVLSNPAHGTLSGIAPNLVYTPNANYNGPDSFSFKANDGQGDSAAATITINVTPINDAPIAQNLSVSTQEDTVLNGNLVATDVDGNTLTYSVVSGPAHGTLLVNANGAYTYTPAANYNGSDSFTYKANDGTLNSNVATVSISVGSNNDAPIALAQALITQEDMPKSITLSATDADGDTLTYSIVSGPFNGTLSGTAPNLVYTPNANFHGSDSFSFKANDGSTDSNVAAISLSVTSINDAPVAQNASTTIAENTAATGTLVATDVDGNALTYSIVTQPAHGSVTVNASTGAYTYTPAANYFGADSFTFKANDGITDSNIATISLNITSVNVAPVANNATATVIQNSSGNAIMLTATDADGDSLTYTVVSGPAHGTITGSAPNLSYTPTLGYVGADSITFKANDGSLNSNVATISITVSDNNGWCNPSFNRRHKLVLNNQDQTEAMANMPVMIKLNSSRITYSDIKAGGADLRFYDSNCQLIPHEIERWDSSGDSFLWVKVSTVAASSNADFIWMHYGNSSAVDAQDKAAVWANNMGAVWHLEETSGSTAADSSANANTLTTVGSVSRNIGGRVAGADRFVNSNERMMANDSASISFTGSLTMESWIYLTSSSSHAVILEKSNGSGGSPEYGMYIHNGATPKMLIGTKYTSADGSIPLNQWVHVSGSFDTNTNVCKLFINGVLKKTNAGCTDNLTATSGNKLHIGGDPSTTSLKAAVDEIRLSNVARSDQWIRVNHLTQTDGFVSYGSQRIMGGSNFNHVLMTIKTGDDDGQVNMASKVLSKNGLNGITYQGSSEGRPMWGYYRFQLPSNIPANATIKKVMLRLYGRDKIDFNNKYLLVTAQNAANSPVISNANQAPGGTSGVATVATGKAWGNPSLAWKLDDWNDSPELKQVIANVVTNQSGLNNGAYVQLWVTRAGAYGNKDPLLSVGFEDNVLNLLGLQTDVTIGGGGALVNVGLSSQLLNTLGIGDIQICLLGLIGINCSVDDERQVGAEDNFYENINHAQLMIEWE